jgi:hypothetical protein
VAILLDIRETGLVYRSLGKPLLRGVVMLLHLGEHLVYLAEKPNSVANRIWIPVAFVPLDQLHAAA